MTAVGASLGPSILVSDSERIVPKTILHQRSYKQAFLNNKDTHIKASTSYESSDEENSLIYHANKKSRQSQNQAFNKLHLKHSSQMSIQQPGHSKDQINESMTIESEDFKIPEIPQSRPKRSLQSTMHKKLSKPTKPVIIQNESTSENIPGKLSIHPNGQITKTVIVKEKIYVNDVGVQAGQSTKGTQTDPIVPDENITQTEQANEQGNPIMTIKGEKDISELINVIAKNFTIKNGKAHWTTKQMGKKLNDMTGISVTHDRFVQSLH